MRAGALARALALAGAAAALAACGRAPAPVPPEERRVGTAPTDAERTLLSRIVEAERTEAFSGLRSAVHGGGAGGRQTRLRVARHAGGPTLVVWQGSDGDGRWVYRSRFPWVDRPDLLLRNYRIEEAPGEGDPVAWRETRRVLVTGRRPGRPSLELLVDAERGLVLAETLRDFAGREWLRTRFDTIRFGPPEEPRPGPETEPLPAAGARSCAPPADFRPLELSSPPAGFERVGREAAPPGGLREEWTDGLAAFSVVQAPACDAEASEGELVRRSCLGRSSVSGVLHGVRVTVLGNLPPDEVERIARSLGIRADR